MKVPQLQIAAQAKSRRPSFVLLTRRDARTDFRIFLTSALQAKGYECYIVRPFRHSTISKPFSSEPATTVGLLDLLRAFRRITCENEPVVVIDSLNLGLPILCLVLRLLCRRAIWAYDLHDHFLYDLRGPSRWIGACKLQLHHTLATFSFHAAPTLATIFPHSHRLGNASHLRRRQSVRAGTDRILILASIDERFDFELVQSLAANRELQFHIYGSLAEEAAPATRQQVQQGIAALTSKPNVVYHGSYVNADLEHILNGYSVMLAPYKLHDRSTRFIEPLRYYHALNNGVRVLTTRIPAAAMFENAVEIISDRATFEQALYNISQDVHVIRRAQPETTWEQRAEQFIAIATAYVSSEHR